MYKNVGKQVYFQDGSAMGLEPIVHIADAANEEAAHSLATAMNERSDYYIADALVTKSPDFHADRVSNAEFKGRVNGAIDALTKLDMVKKSLFYGRDNNLISEGVKDASLVLEDTHSDPATSADIIHAILGIATEAGELLEALRDTYNGENIDWVNVKEELGDIFWYMAILANLGDFTFEEVMKLNNTKLRTGRFKDKFTALEANERNLEGERVLLEGGAVEAAAAYDGYGDKLTLEATPPVSGYDAVKAAEAKSDVAFAQKAAVKPQDTAAPVTKGGAGFELEKSPAERMHPLPGEHLARQPIRPEDAEK